MTASVALGYALIGFAVLVMLAGLLLGVAVIIGGEPLSQEEDE